MLNVFICDDNATHRKQILKCVENCITIHELDMRVAAVTGDPEAIVNYIAGKNISGLYFLDVNLDNKIDGMALARMIRQYDPRGFIVFVTTHDEALPLAFKYKIEAMDFILKDEFYELQSKIHECVLSAQQRYSSKVTELQKNFSFKVGLDKIMTVELGDILFFTTSVDSEHKVMLHTVNGVFEFYGALKDLIKELTEDFYYCHNSYIVNTKQITQFDIAKKTVYLNKGYSCPVSLRRVRGLSDTLANANKR